MGGMRVQRTFFLDKGIIQTKSMDHTLQAVFRRQNFGNNYTGNLALSLPGIKLVIKEFEKALALKFLEFVRQESDERHSQDKGSAHRGIE